MLPMPLSLSFADATNIAVQAGAPVSFGAFAYGGSAGGSTTTDNDTAAPKGDSTSVQPVTTTTISPMDRLADLAGQGQTDIFGAGLQTVGGFLGNSGFGANAAMSQMLPGTQSQMGKTRQAAVADEPSMMPGPLAIAGLGVAAVAVFFMFMR